MIIINILITSTIMIITSNSIIRVSNIILNSSIITVIIAQLRYSFTNVL